MSRSSRSIPPTPGSNAGEPARRPESSSTNAWFPTTFAEMEALFVNAKLSRRAMLVPLDVIEHIRRMVLDENSDIKKQMRNLDGDYEKLKKRLGKDHKDPKTNLRRVGLRVGGSLGYIGYLMLTAPAAVAIFVGVACSASWLYVHQHFLRKWRDLDDARVMKAIEQRDRKHLRVQFDKPAIRQRLARVATWGFLLAFSPFGFAFETTARVQRNARLRMMKRRFEQRREASENVIKASTTRIEMMAKQEARSPVQELPEGAEASRAAHDKHYFESSTPPAPVPAATGPGDVGFGPDEDDLRRRGYSGGSLA